MSVGLTILTAWCALDAAAVGLVSVLRRRSAERHALLGPEPGSVALQLVGPPQARPPL